MKLIIGLGNPGKEYENTRHNIGFNYLDNYINSNNLGNPKERFNGLSWEISKNGEKIIFLKPLSYMNLSGIVVRKYIDYYKININDILVIHDDLDMPVGRIKIKNSGSSGGHNGIRNIIDNLGTEKFLRLKIGISKNNNIEIKDYVLGKFSKDENETLKKRNDVINHILDDYIGGISNEILMGRYNGVNNENI